jgi:hypothetical protein
LIEEDEFPTQKKRWKISRHLVRFCGHGWTWFLFEPRVVTFSKRYGGVDGLSDWFLPSVASLCGSPSFNAASICAQRFNTFLKSARDGPAVQGVLMFGFSLALSDAASQLLLLDAILIVTFPCLEFSFILPPALAERLPAVLAAFSAMARHWTQREGRISDRDLVGFLLEAYDAENPDNQRPAPQAMMVVRDTTPSRSVRPPRTTGPPPGMPPVRRGDTLVSLGEIWQRGEGRIQKARDIIPDLRFGTPALQQRGTHMPSTRSQTW